MMIPRTRKLPSKVRSLLPPLRHSLALIVLLTSPGCAAIYDNTIGLFEEEAKQSEESEVAGLVSDGEANLSATPDTTTVEIKQQDSSRRARVEGVEILWEIPRENLDGFILTYRVGRNSQNRKVTLPVHELEKYEDPKLGFVYRYVIDDIPNDQPLYATIASFRGEHISPASEMITSSPNINPRKRESIAATEPNDEGALQ